MGDDYIKGDTLLPWAPFHSALTAHDRAVIAELSKGDASSSLFRRARLCFRKLGDDDAVMVRKVRMKRNPRKRITEF